MIIYKLKLEWRLIVNIIMIINRLNKIIISKHNRILVKINWINITVNIILIILIIHSLYHRIYCQLWIKNSNNNNNLSSISIIIIMDKILVQIINPSINNKSRKCHFAIYNWMIDPLLIISIVLILNNNTH